MPHWVALPVALCALAFGGCDPFGDEESVESPPPSGGGGKVSLDGGDRCRSNRIVLHPDYRFALIPVVQQLFRDADVRISNFGALKAMRAMVGVCREHRGITYAEAVDRILRTVEDADVFR